MKIRFTLIPIMAALLAAGCGKSGSSEAGTNAGGGSTSTSSGPREVDLTANDTMKFDTTSITAKPGEDLKVVLTNTGSVPIEVMGHNWILLKEGSDAGAFSAAAVAARDNKYIPPSLENEILAKIDLLGPRKSGEVDFKAPEKAGDYPFLCSFPGHYQAGMHGTLTVK